MNIIDPHVSLMSPHLSPKGDVNIGKQRMEGIFVAFTPDNRLLNGCGFPSVCAVSSGYILGY